MPRNQKITFDLTANEQAMMQKLQNLENANARLQKKFDQTKKKGRDAFKGINKSVKNVTAALIGPVSIAGAAVIAGNTIRQVFSDVRQENEKTLEVIERTAKARVRSILNTLAVFGSREKMEAFATEISEAAGVTPEKAFELVGVGVTAGGTVGPGGTLKSAAKLAAFFDRFGIEGETLIEGIITLAKTIDEADAKVSLGFLQQLGTASKITTIESQLNLVKPINALVQQGLSPEKSAEFAAGVNQLLKTDREGRITGTGIINLAESLAIGKIVPTEKIGKGGQKSIQFEKLKTGNFEARIAEIQEIYRQTTPDMRNEIVAKIGGRAAFKTVIRDILSNSTAFQQEMNKAQTIIQAPGPATAALTEKSIAAARGGPVGGILEAGGRGFAAVERARFAKPERAAATQAEKLESEIFKTNAGFFEKILQSLQPGRILSETRTPEERAQGALSRVETLFGVTRRGLVPEGARISQISKLNENQQEMITQLKALVEIAQGEQQDKQTAAAPQTE